MEDSNHSGKKLGASLLELKSFDEVIENVKGSPEIEIGLVLSNLFCREYEPYSNCADVNCKSLPSLSCFFG